MAQWAWRGQNCVGRSFDFGMLSRVTALATQSVTSGVQTAAMITGMAAAGGAQGLMQGRAAGGGFGSLSKLGMLAGAGLGGMGHGLGSSMSGIAKGSGFEGTSMAGNMGSMGDSMTKEFGEKGGRRATGRHHRLPRQAPWRRPGRRPDINGYRSEGRRRVWRWRR